MAGGGTVRNANKEITLFNFYPSEDDPDIYLCKRTHIQGVSVFSQTKVTVDTKGLLSANQYTIRIPQDSVEESFLKPVLFAELYNKSNAFTLNKGDKIVLGFADDENTTPEQLEKKYGYEYVVTITGVTDNRDKREPHWKVTGE